MALNLDRDDDMRRNIEVFCEDQGDTVAALGYRRPKCRVVERKTGYRGVFARDAFNAGDTIL